MNLTRPSSRVHAPPGGKTNFSFGGNSAPTTPVKPVRTPFVEESENPISPAKPSPTPATVSESVAEEVAADKTDGEPVTAPKIGIVIGGFATEELKAAISKELIVQGFKGSKLIVVDELALLPYAARNMTKSCDAVLVACALMDPNGTDAAAIKSSIVSIALSGTKPVIPGVIVGESLLECKALIPGLSTSWIKSITAALSMQSEECMEFEDAPEPEIPEPVVLTPELNEVGPLMNVLRESLKQHGARGICGLGRKFKICDDDHSGQIDLAEFTKAVKEHAMDWSAKQIKTVFDYFDEDKSGGISYDEFLLGVRGELNDRRKQMVLMAFEVLDADKSGIVDITDISAKYSADKHPDVIAGRRTKEDVLREFLDTFDSGDKDGQVTPQEFIKYYGNCSASIDDDDYFELMIRNAWHISGGEGWCANTSCRRVLVCHTDGRQSVEEIKNDIGISADDKELMCKKLIEQGIEDIHYIELNDGTKYKPGGGAISQTAEPVASAPAVMGSRPATAPAATTKSAADAPTAGMRSKEINFDRTESPIKTSGNTGRHSRRGAGDSSFIFG